MESVSPYALAATMYVPATHESLTAVLSGEKYPGLRSVVVCLEDAISLEDTQQAVDNLNHALQNLNSQSGPHRFIRPRTPELAKSLINAMDLSMVCGFVLPKFGLQNVEAWLKATADTHLCWMPTLEDKFAHDAREMRELAEINEEEIRQRILMYRIGGNDLMSCLGLRRPKALTLYDTPVGYTIKMLTTTFKSCGYELSAPVFEQIDNPTLLMRELTYDLAHGFISKTAIHPSQINLINESFKVSQDEYQEAMQIINSNQAVFKCNGAMAEPATHMNWAKAVIEKGLGNGGGE